MKYVAGFMFNKTKTKVALIRKNKPEWQKGLLNGIGGKIEEGEHMIDAMCREFKEETGLKTFYYDWKHLVNLESKRDNWIVDFFYSDTLLENLDELKTTTDEEVIIIDVSNLDNESVIPNLRWLIKMCFDEKHIGGNLLSK